MQGLKASGFGVCVALLVLLAAGHPCRAGEAAAPAATDTVAIWFEAMMQGKVTRLMDVVAVPFSLDGKKVLNTLPEVEAAFQKVADKKGARKVPEYRITVAQQAPPLPARLFPPYAVYRVQLTKQNEAVLVYVSTGDTPKVIGFTD